MSDSRTRTPCTYTKPADNRRIINIFPDIIAKEATIPSATWSFLLSDKDAYGECINIDLHKKVAIKMFVNAAVNGTKYYMLSNVFQSAHFVYILVLHFKQFFVLHFLSVNV